MILVYLYQYRGTLHGLLVTHVDDFLWGSGSHVFFENVIKLLHKIFKIGSVNEKAFQYLGLDLNYKLSKCLVLSIKCLILSIFWYTRLL